MFCPLVRKNPGVGPKPKKKRRLDNNIFSRSPQKLLETSLSIIKRDSTVKEVEKDDKYYSFNMGIENEGFGIEESDPEEEYEPDGDEINQLEEEFEPEEEFELDEIDQLEEEFEPEEEYEPEEEEEEEEEEDPEEDSLFCYDNMEFACAINQAGQEVEIELADKVVGEDKEGLDSFNVDFTSDIFVEKGEYGVDKIKDDDNTKEGHDHLVGEVEDEVFNEECPEVVSEMYKKKKTGIFLGGLDKDATEDDITKVFSEVGEIIDIKLMMEQSTKKNKGFAFLHFATVEQANRALMELKHPVVHGKQCYSCPSINDDTLFLGNICKSWKKEMLEEKLKHFEIRKLKDLTLVEDGNHAGKNRGYAFLRFLSHSDAMCAYKRLQKKDVVFGVDRSAKVSFAYPFVNSLDNTFTKVKRVFLDGVPASWDYNRVQEHLEKFGEIKKIELARYKLSARRKDFGFVTFDSHQAAAACIEAINSTEFYDGKNVVKIKAHLSDPIHKSGWKHQIRGNFYVGHGAATSRDVRDSKNQPPSQGIRLHEKKEIKNGNKLFASHRHRKPVDYRDEQPHLSKKCRTRSLSTALRSYYKKSNNSHRSIMKNCYNRQGEIFPRNISSADYDSRVKSYRKGSHSLGSRKSCNVSGNAICFQERNIRLENEVFDASYNSEFSSMGYLNSVDESTTIFHSQIRRASIDKFHGKKISRAFQRYSEGHVRDTRPSFSNSQFRGQPRKHFDHEMNEREYHYASSYANRHKRSHTRYVQTRRPIPRQESHTLCCTCPKEHSGSFVDYDEYGICSPSHCNDYYTSHVGSQSGGCAWVARSKNGRGAKHWRGF